jgi:hypothetical protein
LRNESYAAIHNCVGQSWLDEARIALEPDWNCRAIPEAPKIEWGALLLWLVKVTFL